MGAERLSVGRVTGTIALEAVSTLRRLLANLPKQQTLPHAVECHTSEALAEFDKPVEFTAARGKKISCGHRPKGWKIRVSNHELGARPCILP